MIYSLVTATLLTTVFPNSDVTLSQDQMIATCAKTLAVTERLKQHFNELPTFKSMSKSNNVITVYISSSGTWTMMLETTDGYSCYIASGNGDVRLA